MIRQCESCHISFRSKPSKRQRFCSVVCKGNWQSSFQKGRLILWSEKISVAKKGKKFSDEHKLNLSMNHVGTLGWRKENPKTPINRRIRTSLEYRTWRKRIYERDNYTCQWCGIRGDYLEADHIKSFSEYPSLRFELNNGRTLCRPCHIKTPTYGRGARS